MDLGLLDRYSREARLFPGLLVVLPVAVSVFALFPSFQEVVPAALLGVGGIVGAVVLTHLVRQRGKEAERRLFRQWGGASTTRRLRFLGASDPGNVARLHEDLEAATGRRLPDRETERSDPRAADEEYRRAVALLREQTRDANRFPVVFAENISYGFRRNSWAMRYVGRGLSTGLLLAAAIILLTPALRTEFGTAGPALTAGVNLGLLWFWSAVVTEEWVRDAADLYGNALFQAAPLLGNPDRGGMAGGR